jgi:plastocyanin
MDKRVIAALVALPLIGILGCGGYSAPTAPQNEGGPPDGAVIINVLGINGTQSFSPNPATVPAGQTVVWHNVDSTTHRVVLDDGRLDTGNISPGRFSTATTLPGSGPYHCAIHPPMVGTLRAGQ